ncbi:hypothetical protein FIBSPDRAFT_965025 [Athelia psychrophila]|uniref:Uncharacterized protein n=1 Tax=Athelia psychrophila TaxID=1759441 RepID=A0A165X3L2_9AGAM|nr:hypothetical protein FIBSPDRAFT_965025 [Fibularhizoctonia sp. CBS 109695]
MRANKLSISVVLARATIICFDVLAAVHFIISLFAVLDFAGLALTSLPLIVNGTVLEQ